MNLVELARKLRPYIEKAAQSLEDTEGLEAVELYPVWTVGMAYGVGYKVQYQNRLYRVLQGHTAMIGWEPDKTPALYAGINETHTGTIDDPIPYEGNMALESGKYYVQGGKTYRCTRDTINPVYNSLYELVGLYVEEVTTDGA